MSSSWTALTTCWPGLRLFDRSCADDAGPDALDERAGHADVDVGFEQRRADLAQGLVDVGVAQPTPAAQAAEDPLEAVGKGVEHAELRLPGWNWPGRRRGGCRRAQSNRASTNSSASKGTRSSGPSPRPTSFTGRPELALDGDDDPALGRAVELGEHDPGDARPRRGTGAPGSARSARWWRRARAGPRSPGRAGDRPPGGSSSAPRPG